MHIFKLTSAILLRLKRMLIKTNTIIKFIYKVLILKILVSQLRITDDSGTRGRFVVVMSGRRAFGGGDEGPH